MIGLVLNIYAELLNHGRKKWAADRIDKKYKDWEKDQEMREDYGWDDQNFRQIPKRKIKSRAARKKHGF